MNILRSYLINLGFHVERGSERQFEGAVGRSAARVAELGAAIEAMGAALAAVVTKMSDRFEDLYYASQRIGSSVENIRAFSFGLSQVGLKAGDAQAALESLADKMRENPAGTRGLLNSLGVQTQDAQGQIRDTTQVFEEAMAALHRRFQEDQYGVGQRIVQSWFGVDPRTYLAMGRDFSEFEQKQRERFRRYGADQQALAEQGKQFAQRFRDTQAAVTTLAEKVFIGLSVRMMPALERFSAWVDRNGPLIADRLQHVLEGVWGLALGVGRIITRVADALVSLDKASHGLSTAILGIILAWRLLNLGFLATPLGAAFLAVTALAGAVVGLYDDYQTWARGGVSLFDWRGWTGLIQGASDAFTDLGDKLISFGKQAGDALKGGLPELGKAVADLGGALVDLASALAPLAGWAVKTFGPSVINFVTTGIRTITDSVHALADAVRVVADVLHGDFKAAARDAAAFGADTLKTVKEPLGVFREFAGDPKKANTVETDRQGDRVVATRRYDAQGRLAEEHTTPPPAPAPVDRFNRTMTEQVTGARPTQPTAEPIRTTITGAPDVKLKGDRLPPLHPQDRSVFQKIADWLNGQPPPGQPAGAPYGELPRGAEGVRQTTAQVRQLAVQALDYFQRQGWTRAQAAGIVANIQYESNFNPRAVGDNGLAKGALQWHPDRQAAFKAWAGVDVMNATREQQYAYLDYELRRGMRQFAGAQLRRTQTAREAGAVVSRLDASPAAGDLNASVRGNLAEQIAAMTPDAPQPQGPRTVNINQTNYIKVQGGDARETAQATGREVGRKNADAVRSFKSVMQ